MGMADDAEETPVSYGPTPGRAPREPAPSALRAEMAYIDFEIDAWARQTFGAQQGSPEVLSRRKFEINQALGFQRLGVRDNG